MNIISFFTVTEGTLGSHARSKCHLTLFRWHGMKFMPFRRVIDYRSGCSCILFIVAWLMCFAVSFMPSSPYL